MNLPWYIRKKDVKRNFWKVQHSFCFTSKQLDEIMYLAEDGYYYENANI